MILFVNESVFHLFGSGDTLPAQPSSITNEFRMFSPPNVKPNDHFKIQNPLESVERGRSKTMGTLEPHLIPCDHSSNIIGETSLMVDAPKITVDQVSSMESYASQPQRPPRDISPNLSRPLPSPHATSQRNLSPSSQSQSRALSPNSSNRPLPSVPVKSSSPLPNRSNEYRFGSPGKPSPKSPLIDSEQSNSIPPKPCRRPSLTTPMIHPDSAQNSSSRTPPFPQRRDVGYLSPRSEEVIPNSFKTELNEKLSAGKKCLISLLVSFYFFL